MGLKRQKNQKQERLEGRKSVTKVYLAETIGRWTGDTNSRNIPYPYLFSCIGYEKREKGWTFFRIWISSSCTKMLDQMNFFYWFSALVMIVFDFSASWDSVFNKIWNFRDWYLKWISALLLKEKKVNSTAIKSEL